MRRAPEKTNPGRQGSEMDNPATTTPEWRALLSPPRQTVARIERAGIPTRPGVYAWFHSGECVYLGKASNLRARLATHLSTSLDLSRSTLRSWVAVRELGLTREYTRRRPTVMDAAQVGVVSSWLRECDLTWNVTPTNEDAVALESALLAAWRPPINAA
ncbi:GIY-YIG nuclease family protein [Microbacterium sp. NPDC089180]|uniref:GIY-YIG nuclease family protein n=2 Tax=Microbacterium TaxID=33882 RepID=UPI003430542E